MKVFFSGKGDSVNMHLVGMTVKEAVELNKIYNNKSKITVGKEESFKEKLSKFKINEDIAGDEEREIEDKLHNMDEYLSWRGNIIKGMRLP
ncbi:hypothetical protein [Clostridium massiliamazoniense]|uniref:hypothetical protein n=1 Tax=Clostridium massiliamazoniense TaxID=1347366 RepID=UPI0006D81192|nr:hypothetical protein [Clostridium massiliamazoniense]